MALAFAKKCQFFRQKWAKIEENCDHRIDPMMLSSHFVTTLVVYFSFIVLVFTFKV
jgi:hypothetical protein